MRNTILTRNTLLLLLACSLLLTACGGANGNTTAEKEGGEEVMVSVQGTEYLFSGPAKAGESVTLIFDMNTLRGCSRAVMIPGTGITKVLTPEDNKITFTPQKAGSQIVACTMNMYRGTLEII